MSYDYQLYSSRLHKLEAPATSDASNIFVDGPNRIEDEDIPPEHLAVVGRKRILYSINLEGVLSERDHLIVDNWLSRLVIDTKGVLIDLQTEKFWTPRTSGLLGASAPVPNRMGRMSFYFEDGEGFYDHGFEAMLGCIAEVMPEALPTRYGYYEPLQINVENGECSGLAAAFRNAPDLFMKSKSPFGHIFVSTPCRTTFERWHPQHFKRRNFLLGKVTFEIRPRLFSDLTAFSRLANLFETLCVLLDVTYAEIVAEYDPNSSWLWYGLPDTNPHTLCIGPAYLNVWPDMAKQGRRIGHHHAIASTDRFGNVPPRPPHELIAPDQGERSARDRALYAQSFPFDYSFDWNTYIW
jgi:hypothetical protein